MLKSIEPSWTDASLGGTLHILQYNPSRFDFELILTRMKMKMKITTMTTTTMMMVMMMTMVGMGVKGVRGEGRKSGRKERKGLIRATCLQ